MRPKFLILLAAIACVAGVFASDARAVEQVAEQAAAPPAQTAQAREPSIMEKMNRNVCEVAGTVLRVRLVDKSPWGSEAPSQMNTVEK